MGNDTSSSGAVGGSADRSAPKGEEASLGEIVEFVKTYAKQETMGPLKGAGSWLVWGVVGAFMLGLGLMLVLLGVLRMFQTEWSSTANGSWSWSAYALTLLVTVILLILTVSRIKKSMLNKPE